MLKNCLCDYGIELNLSMPIFKLQHTAFRYHKSGYRNETPKYFVMSKKEAGEFLNIYNHLDIDEVFRYASYFGIIKNLVLSPYHVEWSYNPYHQRDLFFSRLKLELRKLSQISFL